MGGVGPPSIRPNSAPDGFVLHVYDHDGKLLGEERVAPGGEEPARQSSAEILLGVDPDDPIVLVLYDGDSGRRYSNQEVLSLLRFLERGFEAPDEGDEDSPP
jgi:hypothetical protein